MSGEKDFLSRWSTRKSEARETEATAPGLDAPPPTDAATEFTPEELETLSDAELCERLKLPDPSTLNEGDDFKMFLEARVPERLRRIALRRLWRSNPIFGHLDGLNEYDEDFRAAAAAAGGVVQTLYQVGQGFVKPEEPESDSADTDVATDCKNEKPIPKDVAPQEGCAESDDSAAAPQSGDDLAKATSAGVETPYNAESECGSPPQIKSRRMSFRFVEKSNADK